MELMPSIELDNEIKRIRQAAYKLEHKKRRLSSAATAERQQLPITGYPGTLNFSAENKAAPEMKVEPSA